MRRRGNVWGCSLLILLCFVWSSCQRVLPVELPYEGDRLVLYMILVPDQPFSAQLTRTAPPTGTQPTDWQVADALLQVWEDDQLLDTLVYEAALEQYVSLRKLSPEEGRRYAVRANAPGFPEVRSPAVSLPPALPILGLTLQDSSFETGNSNAVGGILTLETRRNPLLAGGLEYRASNWIDGEAVGFSTCQSGDVRGGCVDPEDFRCLFAHTCLQGEIPKLRLGLTTGLDNRGDAVRAEYLTAELRSLDEDLYQYLSSIGQPYGLEQAFAEPGSLYSNLSGGYGLLGAMNVSYDTLLLE
jgi:hypothetical protein